MNLLGKIYYFYLNGFRSMTVGKRLWILIVIKLIIFFAIMKVFFFPDFLKSNYSTEKDRADAVRHELTNR